MFITRLKASPSLFCRFTGLKVSQFEDLLEQLEPIYAANESRRLKRERQRKLGGGSQFKNSLEMRLLMLLMYYKLYITHEFLGLLFDIDNSNVSRSIRHLSPLLAQIFKVPERRIPLSENDKEALDRFIFDGSEQPINRPQKKQKKFYSGKKKRHTIKWQVTTCDGQTIEAVSKSYPGHMHDKKIYEKTRVVRPPGSKGIGDTGYLGINLVQPKKKKKGQERTKAQKKYNRKISRLRIKVEHVIGAIKRFRILRDTFRSPLHSHNLTLKNVAGLVNFANA